MLLGPVWATPTDLSTVVYPCAVTAMPMMTMPMMSGSETANRVNQTTINIRSISTARTPNTRVITNRAKRCQFQERTAGMPFSLAARRQARTSLDSLEAPQMAVAMPRRRGSPLGVVVGRSSSSIRTDIQSGEVRLGNEVPSPCPISRESTRSVGPADRNRSCPCEPSRRDGGRGRRADCRCV